MTGTDRGRDGRSATRRGLRAVIHRVRSEDSYAVVLLMTIASVTFLSTTTGERWERIVGMSLLGATLLVALHTSSVRPRTFRIAVVLVILAIAAAALTGSGEAEFARFTIALVGSLLVATTPLAMLKRVTQHPVVNGQTVFAGITVYLLLGLLFGFLYMLTAYGDPSAFFESSADSAGSEGQLADLLFFSYTTLTTVGYGNLIPADGAGRMLAVAEALTGQIYLVTVVAIIVGGFASARRGRSADRS